MKRATLSDRALVVNLLTWSFSDQPDVPAIIRSSMLRKKHIRSFMSYAFDLCFMFGEVWLAENRRGCALMLYPERKKNSLKLFWLKVKLMCNGVGLPDIFKTVNGKRKIEPTPIPVTQLWLIGVSPFFQKRGTGSTLLQELLEQIRLQKSVVFLETSVLWHIAWYERFGFQVYDMLEQDYPMYYLTNASSSL